MKRQRKKIKVPSGVPGSFFDKFSPLAIYIWEACKQYYTLDTHLAIDEIMVPFRGCFSHTTKLKNKPVKEDYKI